MAEDTPHVICRPETTKKTSRPGLVGTVSNLQDASSSASSFQAPKTSRCDSGYEEFPMTRRRSSTSSGQPQSSYSSSSSTDRSGRRLTTSSVKYTRPAVKSRHSSATPSTTPLPVHEFFKFPSAAGDQITGISPPSQTLPHTPQPMPEVPLPSPTVNYWTSPESRQREYAAIDAASSGLRGVLVRLLPKCVVPLEYRRTRLYDPDEDCEDDCSVRRFRLCLDDEKAAVEIEGQKMAKVHHKRPGLFKRLSSRTARMRSEA